MRMKIPVKDVDSFTQCMQVLSNPVRFKIYLMILDSACDCEVGSEHDVGGNCVTSISRKLEIPQPSVSNHVKELVNSGLVKSERRGRNVYLFGAASPVGEFENFISYVKGKLSEVSHSTA